MPQKGTDPAMDKHRSMTFSACLLLAFLPAALYLAWLSIMKLTGSAISTAPVVSDEMFWYHQVTAMVDSGRPLGYYGYNGSHAPIGTFGPWGVAILLPYALWGRVFGFGIYSMPIANVTFLGLSLCLFALLGRLSRKEILYVAIGGCTLLMNLFYSISSMAEPLRWSLAVVLTGCMVRVWRGYAGKLFRYVFLPLFLIYSAQAYMLLMLFFPVYLLLVLPVRRFWAKLLLSASLTAVLAVLLRRLLFLVVSPLNNGANVSRSLAGRLREAWNVLRKLTPGALWAQRGTSFGFPSLFLSAFVILLVILTIRILFLLPAQGLNRLGLPAYLLAAYLMAGAVGGYCLIYRNPSLWTVCRGLNTAYTCAVLLLGLSRSKKMTVLCAVFALAALPSFFWMSQNNLKERFLSEKQLALYEQAQEDFRDIFNISEENAPWDNTIAQYGQRRPGVQTALTLAMPRSAGYNSMRNTDIICEAKYALVFHSNKKTYPSILKRLQENGYAISYKHKELTVLTRVSS